MRKPQATLERQGYEWYDSLERSSDFSGGIWTIKSLENTGDILMEQEDRFQEMHTARAEASKKIAEQRIREALRPNITPAAKYKLHTGQEAMDYREKRKK